MNKVLTVMVLGVTYGVSYIVGITLGEKLIEKIEIQKTKDAKIIKIKS